MQNNIENKRASIDFKAEQEAREKREEEYRLALQDKMKNHGLDEDTKQAYRSKGIEFALTVPNPQLEGSLAAILQVYPTPVNKALFQDNSVSFHFDSSPNGNANHTTSVVLSTSKLPENIHQNVVSILTSATNTAIVVNA